MSLIITLATDNPAGHTTPIYLRAETVNHSITRYVAQSPIPATSEHAVGQVYLFDLGSATHQISVMGLVNTTSTGTNDPSKDTLVSILSEWWGFSNMSDVTQLPYISIESSGQDYYVVMKNANFIRDAGTEDRWKFDIQFLVASRKV